MRDWGGIPTEDDKLRVRAVGVKDPGEPSVVHTSASDILVDGVLFPPFAGGRRKSLGASCIPVVGVIRSDSNLYAC